MKYTFTFTKNMRPLLPLFAVVLLAATACSKKNDVQVTGTAHVEFTNASQNDSPFDIYLNGTKKNVSPLAYGQTSDYFDVNAGVQVPGLLKVNATGVTLASFNLQLYPNANYSVFRFGTFTSIYPDDLTIVADKARVRFINLNLGLTDNIDIGITGTPTPVATGLVQAFDSPYYSITPGSSISIYTTGTNTALINIPTTIEAGHVYTIYLSGTTKADLKANILVQK